MKINHCETVVHVDCECECCKETFSFSYTDIGEDEAYVEALTEDCPKCGNPGKTRQAALQEAFG